METLAKKRPTSVTVIGWIYIAVAALMILVGAMSFMSFTAIRDMEGKGFRIVIDNLAAPFKAISAIFQYFDLLAVSQILLGIFLVIASIEFLELHAWARTALEILSWLGLILVVGSGIFWVICWISITASASMPGGTARLPGMSNLVGLAVGTAITAVWALPLIVVIKFLRGKTIRDALTPS